MTPSGVQLAESAGDEKARVARTVRLFAPACEAASVPGSASGDVVTLTSTVPSCDPKVSGETPMPATRLLRPVVPWLFGTWKTPHGVSTASGKALPATCPSLTLNTCTVAAVGPSLMVANTMAPSG